MRPFLALLLATAAAPALAQHGGHGAHAPAADPHAGHTAPAPDPHAGHAAPAPDPHAGHTAPVSDPHAGHGAAASPAPPTAPPPPRAFEGPAHAADLVFGPEAMARARAETREEHGGLEHWKLLVDKAEVQIRDGREGYAWDAQGWYGGDIDKAWFKTEGEGTFGWPFEHGEVQALWSHAVDPWFDVQAGVRQDFGPGPDRTHLALGVQGLAPYWFELDAAAFLSNRGDVTMRFEAEYDLRITRRLILQPILELEAALQDVPELGIGSGLSSGELGARLRYEIRPEFAPYVGVEYERAFGDTADFVRAEGEDAGDFRFLLGVRTWF